MNRRAFLTDTSALFGATVYSGALPTVGAAQSTPDTGGSLIRGHPETTQNRDMHQPGTASTGRVLQNVHNSTVTADKDLTVIPMRTECSSRSENGLVYTFKLRAGVKFHNGAAMTSEDVKYSFERCPTPRRVWWTSRCSMQWRVSGLTIR